MRFASAAVRRRILHGLKPSFRALTLTVGRLLGALHERPGGTVALVASDGCDGEDDDADEDADDDQDDDADDDAEDGHADAGRRGGDARPAEGRRAQVPADGGTAQRLAERHARGPPRGGVLAGGPARPGHARPRDAARP
jgi:hypothetical protein